MPRPVKIILILLLVGGVASWWFWPRKRGDGDLVLQGNVDLRQADLPFNNSERIAEVLVREGDRVQKGQLIARLETSRITPLVAQAQANVAAQQQALLRLRNGSRPEEIAQANANVEAARADAANAERQYSRLKKLYDESNGRSISQQDLDTALAARDVAAGKLMVNQKALELTQAGPRAEDIAQAAAQLQATEAQLAQLRQQLADAELTAPMGGVIRSRIMEPGEIATPQKPVVTLAIIDPKWVRAYVSETDLGRVKPGQRAWITVDSFPNRRFEGWVGFISPVAEFTPKPVQTTELRTSLVYEVRVFVTDPADDLRLGMPATVRFGASTDIAMPQSQPATQRITTTPPTESRP